MTNWVSCILACQRVSPLYIYNTYACNGTEYHSSIDASNKSDYKHPFGCGCCNEQFDQDHWCTCVPYYCHVPLKKNASNTAHMSHCTSTTIYIKRPCYCIHPSKINKLKYVITILQNVPGTICPSNATCPNYSTCISVRCMPVYMPHINSFE